MVILQITPDELKQLISDAVLQAVAPHTTHQIQTSEPFIKGIHALAKFLDVSPVKAQQLKNKGAFPYWQDGRTILFDPVKVREFTQRSR